MIEMFDKSFVSLKYKSHRENVFVYKNGQKWWQIQFVEANNGNGNRKDGILNFRIENRIKIAFFKFEGFRQKSRRILQYNR